MRSIHKFDKTRFSILTVLILLTFFILAVPSYASKPDKKNIAAAF